jgi:SPP1 gp7 family putative phage head morphogenesis protein
MPSFVRRFNDAVGRKRVSARVRKALENAPTQPSQALGVYRTHAQALAERIADMSAREFTKPKPDWEGLKGRIAKLPVRQAARRAGKLAQDHAVREMERSLGKTIARSKAGDQAVLDAFVAEQERLLARIAQDQVAAIQKAIADGMTNPLETLHVSRNRLILVSGDQTHKVFAEAQAAYGPANGSDSYVWVTRADERVRPGHARLHRTIQKWSSPPNTGRLEGENHPGQAIRCRCTAAPLLNSQ